MPFDQNTRNRLQRFVADARALLTAEFTRRLQNEYGMDPETGQVADLDSLVELGDARRETGRLLRALLDHYLASGAGGPREALERIAREQSFTLLNRLSALRMAEARGLLLESVARGYQSQAFQLYSRVAGPSLGETGDAYRCFLFSLFDELALDLPALFDRHSPMGCLFPREATLLALLDLINHEDLAPLWEEDETIGWIYQYFNSPEERRRMRAESSAPRNSRELAVRNQFFTPRYVVEFLADNTLGRTWYEMTQGQTSLKESCRYLVRRPQEVFLAEGQEPPGPDTPADDLSPEGILRQPDFIAFRRCKDPRELRLLDPACGSMHFGLYAFDLFERLYEEAWDRECARPSAAAGGRSTLTADYPSREAFLRDVPRLIVEHNLHGIDIDPRAVQIAGLSLWLRAQRSWQRQGLRPQDRPRIRRSQIVCAEPMPGEREMLGEFAQGLKPRVLGQLLEILFDRMQLAGEAGSLLKIEEEIAAEVEKAREEFHRELLHRRRVAGGGYLPGMEPQARMANLFDFADLPGRTQFWTTAEQQILDALRLYAEQAEESHSMSRRLFAEDTARGFAFIDLCRKRYDVVLMNPPFGEAVPAARQYLQSRFPRSKQDQYACFVERWLQALHPAGMLGAITSRTGFFLSSFQKWREEVLPAMAHPSVIADLGVGVMDAAMVEAAAYCLTARAQDRDTVSAKRGDPPTTFLRMIEAADKADALRAAIAEGQGIRIDTAAFQAVPGSPFCYWTSDRVRRLFRELPPLESEGRTAKQGLATADDFRFLRLWWEVPSTDAAKEKRRWFPFAKGGAFSPFYADVHLVVNWESDGAEIKNNLNEKGGIRSNVWMLKDTAFNYFFRPGLTWSLRTTSGLSMRVLPACCIFSHKGPSVFILNNKFEDLLALLAIVNSRSFSVLVELQLAAADAAARSYEVGVIQRTPVPRLTAEDRRKAASFALQAWTAARDADTANETSHIFFPWKASEPPTERDVCPASFIEGLYGLPPEDLGVMPVTTGTGEEEDEDEEGDAGGGFDRISYALGAAFGRWDVRLARQPARAAALPGPFDPLPPYSPAALQEPAIESYPIGIPPQGILVDDPGHELDVESRLRQVLQSTWPERAEAVEQEACETLGVRSLRDYLRRPAGFFADHLKRYSRSRRQAPIYWPLAVSSGSYTLWIYYHRLTDQTLYACVNDFIDPKRKQTLEAIAVLQRNTARGSTEEKKLEALTQLAAELRELGDELLRWAPIWKPNLNDGVQITAAPLWRLFRWPKWQKTLKETWQRLERGDYDWAHLACRLWPERVRGKCPTDKSLALAHGLESLYQGPPPGQATRRPRSKTADNVET